MTWCDEPFYGTGDMVDCGNGRTCDWRCELSSFWLKLVVNWTFTIPFSDVQSGFPAETVDAKLPTLHSNMRWRIIFECMQSFGAVLTCVISVFTVLCAHAKVTRYVGLSEKTFR